MILTNPQRRLLKHVARIDPNPAKLDPGQYEDAAELQRIGLVECGALLGIDQGRLGATITAKGREEARRGR